MRKNWKRALGVAIWSVSLGMAAPLLGQKSSPYPGASPGSSSDQDRSEQYVTFLRGFDANRNGQIDAEEAEGKRGYVIRKMADRAKIQFALPLSIERFQAGLKKHYSADAAANSKPGVSSAPSRATAGMDAPIRHPAKTMIRHPAPNASSDSAAAGQRKSYRFRSPTERLPDGLPNWFAQKDADSDGQVAMAEYASSWTDAKALEFTRVDLNNDGLITPKECLRAEELGYQGPVDK
ncbi:MAG: hypothetical protein HQ581_08350 [Planctomycetes bacterium]|nr:hypothetical protein [Planctomycetota bacterium]